MSEATLPSLAEAFRSIPRSRVKQDVVQHCRVVYRLSLPTGDLRRPPECWPTTSTPVRSASTGSGLEAFDLGEHLPPLISALMSGEEPG
jgi:hypothetical protein